MEKMNNMAIPREVNGIKLTNSAKLVYLWLCDFENDTIIATTNPQIAKETGLSIKSVITATKTLVAAGMIEVLNTSNEGKKIRVK